MSTNDKPVASEGATAHPQADAALGKEPAASVKRVPFHQSKEHDRRCYGSTNPKRMLISGDIYSDAHCCVCYRPVKPDAARLALSRDNSGEWYAVAPGEPEAPDEHQMGRFTLPIGPDCLRAHPEWHFAVMPAASAMEDR